MKTLGVITCAKSKNSRACKASEMYMKSTMFKLLKKYVEEKYDEYVILSAKYGALRPNEIIEPYEDITFFKKSKKSTGRILTRQEKKKWAAKVFHQINWKDYYCHFHISVFYWQYLEPFFNENKIAYERHKFKKGVGSNLAYLKKTLIVQQQNNLFEL